MREIGCFSFKNEEYFLKRCEIFNVISSDQISISFERPSSSSEEEGGEEEVKSMVLKMYSKYQMMFICQVEFPLSFFMEWFCLQNFCVTIMFSLFYKCVKKIREGVRVSFLGRKEENEFSIEVVRVMDLERKMVFEFSTLVSEEEILNIEEVPSVEGGYGKYVFSQKMYESNKYIPQFFKYQVDSSFKFNNCYVIQTPLSLIFYQEDNVCLKRKIQIKKEEFIEFSSDEKQMIERKEKKFSIKLFDWKLLYKLFEITKEEEEITIWIKDAIFCYLNCKKSGIKSSYLLAGKYEDNSYGEEGDSSGYEESTILSILSVVSMFEKKRVMEEEEEEDEEVEEVEEKVKEVDQSSTDNLLITEKNMKKVKENAKKKQRKENIPQIKSSRGRKKGTSVPKKNVTPFSQENNTPTKKSVPKKSVTKKSVPKNKESTIQENKTDKEEIKNIEKNVQNIEEHTSSAPFLSLNSNNEEDISIEIPSSSNVDNSQRIPSLHLPSSFCSHKENTFSFEKESTFSFNGEYSLNSPPCFFFNNDDNNDDASHTQNKEISSFFDNADDQIDKQFQILLNNNI